MCWAGATGVEGAHPQRQAGGWKYGKVTFTRTEPVITFNGQEAEAELYTCYPPQIRKLDKLCRENPDVYQCVRITESGKPTASPKNYLHCGAESGPETKRMFNTFLLQN